jgi:hypothetical protein
MLPNKKGPRWRAVEHSKSSCDSAPARGPCQGPLFLCRLLLALRPRVSVAARKDFATPCTNVSPAHVNVPLDRLKSDWCAMLPASARRMKIALSHRARSTSRTAHSGSSRREPFHRVAFDRQRLTGYATGDDFAQQRCPRQAAGCKAKASEEAWSGRQRQRAHERQPVLRNGAKGHPPPQRRRLQPSSETRQQAL